VGRGEKINLKGKRGQLAPLGKKRPFAKRQGGIEKRALLFQEKLLSIPKGGGASE